MISSVIRFVKRFGVLIPGLIIAYFSVRTVFPYFDNRLPVALAIFITYLLAAYVLIPALIRLFRLFWPAKHLPLYCVTPDGFASDPLNIGIIGSRRGLIQSMNGAGWEVADRHTPLAVAREILSIIFRKKYLNAPMSSLYLFGRKQDIGFEKQISSTRGQRHHVRFWATTYDDEINLQGHKLHWHNRKAELLSSELLWIGAASRDNGFAVIRHNIQLSHMISPDTDSERELIASGLLDSGVASLDSSVRLISPYKITNRVWYGYLQTDGIMKILRLKHSRSGK